MIEEPTRSQLKVISMKITWSQLFMLDLVKALFGLRSRSEAIRFALIVSYEKIFGKEYRKVFDELKRSIHNYYEVRKLYDQVIGDYHG